MYLTEVYLEASYGVMRFLIVRNAFSIKCMLRVNFSRSCHRYPEIRYI